MKTEMNLLARASLVAVGLTAVFMPSCSNSSFNSNAGGPPAAGGKGDKSPAENGNNNPPGFAAAGKTLDLYVIMDKSGSLYIDPSTQQPNSGSDVACKRFDAMLDLVDSLRTKLNSNEEVRLTVVTFSKSAKNLGTMNSLLSQSRKDVSSKFRAGVCDNPDYDTTNYERGISVALQSHDDNLRQKKLDLESVVFFSDGAAKDKDTGILQESIRRLNSTFSSRVYGVLLGRTNDQCVLRDSNGRNLQTQECMLKVVGNESTKLLSVEDANGLSAAWSDLVNK
ncbi:MAG: hypothetical protein RI953_2524 [Pseudomonadota bacterium]